MIHKGDTGPVLILNSVFMFMLVDHFPVICVFVFEMDPDTITFSFTANILTLRCFVSARGDLVEIGSPL